MKFFILLVLLPVFSGMGSGQELPKVYEYFREGDDNSGLIADSEGFKLNGKPLRIYSGAVHYFRIHPDYWRDRLRKLRATGCNTVETYVPWNLHEPTKSNFDFGDKDNDMSMFLNVTRFIEIAQEEDLLVLFRPGPYICSEWDFGGLPSWLQRDPNMRIRTGQAAYLQRVMIFFDALMPKVSHLQFTNGGSIIGVQLENEYGSYHPKDTEPYLRFLMGLQKSYGITSLLFTSDGAFSNFTGTLPEESDVLKTVNFQSDPDGNIGTLLRLQPDKPVFVMEYWSGWFDHWFKPHHTVDIEHFTTTLDRIIGHYNGSVNYYMFHGGTNFGFMNGANARPDEPRYDADVTSYDYDCPLSEAGDYTEKYHKAIEIMDKYSEPKLWRPEMVEQSKKVQYETIEELNYISYENLIEALPVVFDLEKPVSMENLPESFNEGCGQSYGYIVYRKTLTPEQFRNGSVLRAGRVKDFGILLVNGVIQNEFDSSDWSTYWFNSEKSIVMNAPESAVYHIDVLIENMGRINFGWAEDFEQQKGLPDGKIFIDDIEQSDFQVFPMEFKSNFVKSLGAELKKKFTNEDRKSPRLMEGEIMITDTPGDTWINMEEWHKGIVFVNGFNIGRYFRVGPQQNLYIPAPLLRTGINHIHVFEMIAPATSIKFSDVPNVGF